jgi:hypothetical protein
MSRAKSIEEVVQNYVIGAIQGAYKTKRHWIKEGYDEAHAIKNAVKYGIGQISAGIGGTCDLKTAVKMFRKLAVISTTFADTLEEVNE